MIEQRYGTTRMALGARIAALGIFAAGAAQAADPRPLALVEQVENAPAASVRPFDYLYPGAEVDLRPSGTATIAYFDSCVVETFTGGRLKAGKDAVKTGAGGKASRVLRRCQTSALKLAPSRTEAGVAVKRVTPFDEARWREIATASARPLFVWPRTEALKSAKVSIYFLDAQPKTEVWSGTSDQFRLEYPADAPALAEGMPYEVVVQGAGPALSTVFSIDPGLALDPGALNSAIPLGL
ncbi:MAG: hypothetical protein ABW042_11170 [Phenylobacterium sp.]